MIDVSGDGPNNYGPPVAEARDRAVAEGIVVNGLPILIRPSPIVTDIVRYYSDCVIGGPGRSCSRYGVSRSSPRRSAASWFWRLPHEPHARIIPVQLKQAADCLIGEKARERYSDPYYPQLDN